MPERKIVTGDTAQKDIFEGMQQLARAVDLRVFGIIDPALVVTMALKNASSIAIALLRSQGVCVMARNA